MKKEALFGLLFFTVAALLGFAKGGSQDSGPVIAADFIGNRNGKIQLTVSAGPHDTIASSYESRRAYITEAYTRWVQKHPDVGIEFQLQTPGEISQDMARILTEAMSGMAPDFFHLDSFWVGNFLDAGVLQPLDPYLSNEEKNAFFEWTRGVTTRNGVLYALWAETDARLLYYRKDLIPAPPRTWDQLIQTALDVKNKHNIIGFLTPAGYSESASNENTWAYFWAQGGEILGPDSRPILGEGANRQKMINIYAFMKRLIDTGASPREIVSMTGFDPILSEVKSNNVAMLIEGTWAVSQIRDLVPDAESKWDFAPYPQMSADLYANSNGGWTWAILTKDTEKQRAAMTYIMEVACGYDAMAERCKRYNYMPTRKDVFEKDSFFSTDPMQQRFYKELQNGHARPASSIYPAISDINARMMGEVLIGNRTPEQAVDELQRLCLEAWQTWQRTQRKQN